MNFVQILKYVLAVIAAIFVVYGLFFFMRVIIFMALVGLIAGLIYRRYLR